MVNISIKDELGKIIFLADVERDDSKRYERSVAISEDDTMTVTISWNNLTVINRNWSERDIEAFNLIASLIRSDLSRNFSIEELSAHAGMNRTKLQAGFKQLFSSTIYVFTQELKMQRAKSLILDNKGYTLKEIARMLGYRHTNHFSVAFKKKFSAAPSVIKKQG